MPTTSRGIVYPDSTGATSLWTHYQNLATTTDTAIGTAVAPGPICKLQLQSNFSLANNNNLTVPFGTGSEIIKSDASLHSTTVNNTRIIPNKAGYYLVTVLAWFNTNTSGVRGAFCGKNGSVQAPEYQWTTTLPNNNFALPQLSTELYANGTTDYFEMFVYQNSGGALDVLGSASTRASIFSVSYIRA